MVERGVWRTFNPYNPYDASQEMGGGGPAQTLESLDDLFGEETDGKKEPVPVVAQNSSPASSPKTMNSNKPDAKRQEELVDIQKELEAKFDELFGSLDDNE